jgi:hypothetical protein
MAARADLAITLAARANMDASRTPRFSNLAKLKTSSQETITTHQSRTLETITITMHIRQFRNGGTVVLGSLFNTEMIWATQKRYAH